MPTPAADSAIRLLIFNGSTTIGNVLVSPIPAGNGFTIGTTSALTEISPTNGNIYSVIYLTAGSSQLDYLEKGSVVSYTHGGTKLLQNGFFY
jgi:hypothetical protein